MTRYSASRGIRYTAPPGPEADRPDQEEPARSDAEETENGRDVVDHAGETDGRADRQSCRADD